MAPLPQSNLQTHTNTHTQTKKKLKSATWCHGQGKMNICNTKHISTEAHGTQLSSCLTPVLMTGPHAVMFDWKAPRDKSTPVTRALLVSSKWPRRMADYATIASDSTRNSI